MTVHPRWRGERAEHWQTGWVSLGSSPLARGTHGVGDLREVGALVHPRWRGERLFVRPRNPIGNGSSPLARGTRKTGRSFCPIGRFIPAGAGNARVRDRRSGLRAVHPRWRGERALFRLSACRTRGSSPLARGTRVSAAGVCAGARFIPAGAGNAAEEITGFVDRAVHPRWRGERSLRGEPELWDAGSSPLARGTPTVRGMTQRDHRFIPAGAGNASRCTMHSTQPTVHPRWRGERCRSARERSLNGGSSPLARGTPLRQSP